ncbi:MAG: site-specific DNA-methyltransferase [Caldilineales bacterium]|nr:site-specific DNA-methyltransferase [Caldilineales bacterium]MCW5858168.1 site-specific DNA-methyltransferase [Caldilineales bacterium]
MTGNYSIDTNSQELLKEQLRLFAFENASVVETEFVQLAHERLSTRERLAALLEGELNFHGQDSGYASHDLHAFAAKFPPQLPLAFIRGLTKPGEIVLDPMMGSGTTVVEAMLEGRYGIGLDLDPLALRLADAKTTTVDVDGVRQAGHRVLTRAKALLDDGNLVDNSLVNRFDSQTRAFVDYWYFQTTQRELMALILAIDEIPDLRVRRFLELTFSSIIVTKSGGVSRARDLAHSRPHLDGSKIPRNAIDQFSVRLRKNLASIAQIHNDGVHTQTVAADARYMPLRTGSVDLIVTSPPYANAIDYMRAHKFSLVWLGRSVAALTKLRSEYIGSERIRYTGDRALPERAQTTIDELSKRDRKQSTVLHKYFVEMSLVLAEMHRVLHHDAAAVVVVGTSTMRNIDVQTHLCLADIGADIGFDVVGVAQRALDRNKRMMPARFGRKTDSMIEQRMHDEYVIGFLKPPIFEQDRHNGNNR